jgi:hypothetical protein
MGKGTKPKGWYNVTRQMHAAIAKAGQAGRVEIFNGNYGLCRGLAAGLGLAAVLGAMKGGLSHWHLPAVLIAGAAMCVYRMHRFGVHYARELFVQFLALATANQGVAREGGK